MGGKLDGAYGVVAGLEVLQALQDAGVQTERPVEVVVWTNEEGSRFGPGCMGSSAYVDPSRVAGYRAVRDGRQQSFGEAVDRALQALPDVPRRAPRLPLAGFVELHIEQGPVLETAGVPLGVVTGIQSVRWYRVKVSGVAAHAGTTPMDIRTDAMAACIQMAHRLYAEAAQRQASGLRLTLGRWVVGPNSINTIPGEVEFTIDMRCVDESVLAGFDAVMREVLQACAGRTRVALEPIFERKPTHFPPAMTALVQEAGQRAGGACGAPGADLGCLPRCHVPRRPLPDGHAVRAEQGGHQPQRCGRDGPRRPGAGGAGPGLRGDPHGARLRPGTYAWPRR